MMAPNGNSVVCTSAYGADKASDLPNSEVVQEYPQVACLQTPCVLDGERVIAFVDSEATDSFVSQKLVKRVGWTVVSRIGNIQQCLTGSSTPRLGAVESLILENGNKRLKVDLEVADLGGEEELIIGVDLFRPLGFTIQNVPFTWPEVPEEPLGSDVSLKRELDGGPESTEI
jgi:hypothetical protein